MFYFEKEEEKRHLCDVVLAVIYLQTLVYSSSGGETETDSIFDRCFDAHVVETVISRFFFFLFFPRRKRSPSQSSYQTE